MQNAVCESVDSTPTTKDTSHVGRSPRIALLSPYNGGNLGDAVIQDALIANLRQRLPEAEFSGICLNCDNFVDRHGSSAFPLCANDRPFYHMSHGSLQEEPTKAELAEPVTSRRAKPKAAVKALLSKVPWLAKLCRVVWRVVRIVPRELQHAVAGYRFLRRHDLLIVSGGGQLDDEWGGCWGHPFALLKWGTLARLAGVPLAIVSVGVGRFRSKLSQGFVTEALRLATYRSYRDSSSKLIATRTWNSADADAVIPDLAFSLPVVTKPRRFTLDVTASKPPVIAISPIVYGRPESWPTKLPALHTRYMQEMALVVSHLLSRGYKVVMVSSSIGDDDKIITKLLASLDEESRERVSTQLQVPVIRGWKDLFEVLKASDYLIASRLHSLILGYVSDTPGVAISFDPKVDWLMENVHQSDCLLHIDKFSAKDVVDRLDSLISRGTEVAEHIRKYRAGLMPAFAGQYDHLAAIAVAQAQ